MSKDAKQARSPSLGLLADVCGIAGAASITAGVAVMHWPSALIVGGAFALGLAVLCAKVGKEA